MALAGTPGGMVSCTLHVPNGLAQVAYCAAACKRPVALYEAGVFAFTNAMAIGLAALGMMLSGKAGMPFGPVMVCRNWSVGTPDVLFKNAMVLWTSLMQPSCNA